MSKRSPRSSPDRLFASCALGPCFAAACLLVLAIPSSTFGAGLAEGSDGSRDELVEIVREITADGSYQTEFPGRIEEQPTDPSRWAGLGSVASLLLLAVLTVVLALGATWLVIEFHSWKQTKRAKAEPAVIAAAPADGLARDAEEPARLAGEGRYAEAIHSLLLLAIGSISRRLDFRARRSLTSRELMREFPLDDHARRAFTHLVLAVEMAHFGGAAVGADDYQRCVEHFRRSTGA